MTTYAEYATRVLTALGDPGGEKYDPQLVYDAVCSAFDAVLPWASPHDTTTFTSDGLSTSFTLPGDIYRIDGVQDVTTQLFAERVSINPTNRPRQNQFQWLEWPQGTLKITTAIPSGSQILVYYSAYWEKPANSDDETFILTIPRVVETGALFWACSYVLVPTSIGTANVRQYNQRIDSGAPTDNPIEQSAKFLRTLFIDEMNRLPKLAGGS